MLLTILCPHDQGLAPYGEQASDYHPLSRLDVDALTEMIVYADQQEAELHIINKVRTRLSQGLPGMHCPRPSFGLLAAHMQFVDDLALAIARHELAPEKGASFIWRIFQERRDDDESL